jgi:hypothetical protein
LNTPSLDSIALFPRVYQQRLNIQQTAIGVNKTVIGESSENYDDKNGLAERADKTITIFRGKIAFLDKLG